jgi:hypothetical protein
MHTPAQRRNQIVVSPDRCQLLAHAAVAVRRPHTNVKPWSRIDLSLGIAS